MKAGDFCITGVDLIFAKSDKHSVEFVSYENKSYKYKDLIEPSVPAVELEEIHSTLTRYSMGWQKSILKCLTWLQKQEKPWNDADNLKLEQIISDLTADIKKVNSFKSLDVKLKKVGWANFDDLANELSFIDIDAVQKFVKKNFEFKENPITKKIVVNATYQTIIKHPQFYTLITKLDEPVAFLIEHIVLNPGAFIASKL